MTLLGEGRSLATAQALAVPHAPLAGDIDNDVAALVSQGSSLRAASRGLADMAQRFAKKHGIAHVGLSGGVLQKLTAAEFAQVVA